MIVAYIVSVVASFIVPYHLPTVGFSCILYYLIGAIDWRGRIKTFNGIVIIICLASGFFVKNMNAPLHLVCFSAGLIISKVSMAVKSFTNDYKRAAK